MHNAPRHYTPLRIVDPDAPSGQPSTTLDPTRHTEPVNGEEHNEDESSLPPPSYDEITRVNAATHVQ
jgi:hypothetical protein